MLANMPNVGTDADFAREQADRRSCMYLVDTDVISEARKGDLGNARVRAFFPDLVRKGPSFIFRR